MLQGREEISKWNFFIAPRTLRRLCKHGGKKLYGIKILKVLSKSTFNRFLKLLEPHLTDAFAALRAYKFIRIFVYDNHFHVCFSRELINRVRALIKISFYKLFFSQPFALLRATAEAL